MSAERVLVIDDDPLIVELVRESLEQGGYQVLSAADGLEGFETMRGEHPDLVVRNLREAVEHILKPRDAS